MTTCIDFDVWLNEGMPHPGATPSLAHAEQCPRCNAAWSAVRELESALSSAAFMAPTGFTDAVMSRIQRTSEVSGHAPAMLPSPISWWVRAAEQPASVLAVLVAGLVLWKSDAIRASALAAAFKLGQLTMDLKLPALGEPLSRPVLTLGLTLALLPTAVLASLSLYHWAERWAGLRRAA